MALFKPFMGNRASLDAVEKHAGYVYLCVDDGSFHLDFLDDKGQVQRKQINANEANKIVGYDISPTLALTDSQIPTSAAVLSALAGKADKVHDHNDTYYTESEIDAKLSPIESHISDSDIHVTAANKTNWTAAYTHSQAAHAPSNAEKNQNAFSKITVGSTTIEADTATDTLTLVGSNVTITPDATNDKVTFAVANGTTSAKGIVQLTNSTSSTSTTTAATPNSVKSAYDLAKSASDALKNKSDISHSHDMDDLGIYVQNTEPTSAVAGDIWIDTANDPAFIVPNLPEVTSADNGKILMVVNGRWQAVTLNLTADANGVVSI